MTTLFIQNVPDDRYQVLKHRAKRNRRSVAAEILALLEEWVPTEKEIGSRRESIRRLESLKFSSTSTTPMPSSLDLIREERDR